MVVVDELTSFKSHQAQRFKKLKLIRPYVKKFVGLTGTPTPKSLLDLWSQLYLCDQGRRLGRTITEYRNNYFTPDKRNQQIVYSYKLLPGAEAQIRSLISDICVSMSADDYLDLPDIVYDTRYVKLDPESQKRYTQLERERILEVNTEVIDAMSAAALGNKLLQLGNGAVYKTELLPQEDGTYTEERKVIEIHDCKLEALQEMLEELNGEPALIFYNFKHDLDRMRRLFEKMKLNYGELKTPEDIDRWNSRQLTVLLAHPASAAYGLNLQTGGHHVIWFGLNWSLELYEQANARLHRQGQQNKVIVHHLAVEGSIDEKVIEALADKEQGQEALLSALKAKIRDYTDDT